MRIFSAKGIVAAIAVLVVLAGFAASYHLLDTKSPAPVATGALPPSPTHTVIGHSVQGRAIDAYTYGTGATHLLFVGGMHGGYEWNAVVLAYDFKEYLDTHPEAVPAKLTITVIPSLNVDGVYKVVGREGPFTDADVPASVDTVPGRVNADGVDLNRNFDCHWQSNGTWKNTPVSGGLAAFSEPESSTLRDFVSKDHPVAVVFWHSQSGTVYASACDSGILPQTLDIMHAYASAAGYAAVKSFDSYPVTGDAEGWLASIGIPAITVELTTHTTVEWNKNLAGTKALFEYYGRPQP